MPKTKYRVDIPDVIVSDPGQAIIDGFTIIYQNYGMEGVDKVLEAVMETVYPSES